MPRSATTPAVPTSETSPLREWPLVVSVITALLFFAFGDTLLGGLDATAKLVGVLGWLFAVVLLSAFAVVRHAEALAELLGEPLGTLVLTISVIAIEVMMISATMATGDGSPALARDTMFAVLMIVLNALVGLALLLGGLRHHEQTYNLQGANAYLAVVVPLAVLTLVLPNYTQATPDPTFSVGQSALFALASVVLYGVFLAIQNVRHQAYFLAPDADPDAPTESEHHAARSVPYHGALLVAYLLPLVLLSKQFSTPLDISLEAVGAPAALGGFIVALLVLSPESMSAIRAAQANRLQRSVNLLLGSALATISLTVPAVLVIGFVKGQSVVLGLGAADMVLLVLTLFVSTLTFASARTNVLLGVVHLLLFAVYVTLLFEG